MELLKNHIAIFRYLPIIGWALLFFPALAAAAGVPCGRLVRTSFPNTTIDSARTVQAGTFVAPPEANDPRSLNIIKTLPRGYASLSSFCQVAATIRPVADSEIRVEVWMPESGWNNKFAAVGNGGWAGSIRYADMAVTLNAGYATASTDTGHKGNSGVFGFGHPEKLTDYSYRAVHEMTVFAKAIVNTFYGTSAKTAFFNGCSLGGHQALMEAEKYPADFDGIVAGAPSLNWARLNLARVYVNRFVNRTEDSYIPPETYSVIHDAVLQACDGLDGVKDGVLEDPTKCHFEPKVLQCKADDSTKCLTAAQVQSAEALYGPVMSAKTGKQLYPVIMQPGSEMGWGVVAGREPTAYAREALQYLVYKDPKWDWHQFTPSTDLDAVLGKDTGLTDFEYPTLKSYFDRGGKLLIYHGWSDATISPVGTVDYFESIVQRLGKRVVGKSVQLYMVPGMDHCANGYGTDTFDKLGAIEQWVAKGKAPAKIVASRVKDTTIERTRPLCPYGQIAKYKGHGSTDDASNFTCSVRK